MLQLTQTFGPTINIIIEMAKDMMVFFLLFFLQIFAFAILGMLIFPKMKAFLSFDSAIITLYQASFGAWNLSTFEQDYDPGENAEWEAFYALPHDVQVWTHEPHPKHAEYYLLGMIYMCAFIAVNCLIMVNMVVAIMSDTYNTMTQTRMGIYYSSVIQAVPVYKNDNRYGSLISNVPPLNMLFIPLLPLFLSISDENTLIKLNRIVNIGQYFPVCLFLMAIFTVVNLALIPFAYLIALFHKIIIATRKKDCKSIFEVLVFTIFGLLFCLLSLFRDLYSFI
jgi:hypothetical protein